MLSLNDFRRSPLEREHIIKDSILESMKTFDVKGVESQSFEYLLSEMENYFSTHASKSFKKNPLLFEMISFKSSFARKAYKHLKVIFNEVDNDNSFTNIVEEIVENELAYFHPDTIEENFLGFFPNDEHSESIKVKLFDTIYMEFIELCTKKIVDLCIDCALEPTIISFLDDAIVNVISFDSFSEIIDKACGRAVKMLAEGEYILENIVYLDLFMMYMALLSSSSKIASSYFTKEMVHAFESASDNIVNRIYNELKSASITAYINALKEMYYEYKEGITQEDIDIITDEITAMEI